MQGRGLPGTHDPILGAEILERLSYINEKQADQNLVPVSLPVFDKSAYRGFGDRSNETVSVHPPVDVVILEGWCFGFQPLSFEELEMRYNPSGTEEGSKDTSLDGSHIADELSTSRSRSYFKSHSLKSLADINRNLQNYADLWYRYFTHFIQVRAPILLTSVTAPSYHRAGCSRKPLCRVRLEASTGARDETQQWRVWND